MAKNEKTPCKRMTILTLNPTFAGERCGVPFRAGRGTTTDRAVAAALADAGCAVVDDGGNPIAKPPQWYLERRAAEVAARKAQPAAEDESTAKA